LCSPRRDIGYPSKVVAIDECAAREDGCEEEHRLHEIHVERHRQEHGHGHRDLQARDRTEDQADEDTGYHDEPGPRAREEHIQRGQK
jgi:hypothetical protein